MEKGWGSQQRSLELQPGRQSGEEPGVAGLLRAKEAREGRSKSPENRLKTKEGAGKAEQQGFHQITISSCLYSTASSQLSLSTWLPSVSFPPPPSSFTIPAAGQSSKEHGVPGLWLPDNRRKSPKVEQKPDNSLLLVHPQ